MAATLPKVEAYLRKKWFDADTVGFRRAACAALHVAAGSGELAIVVSNAGSILIVR